MYDLNGEIIFAEHIGSVSDIEVGSQIRGGVFQHPESAGDRLTGGDLGGSGIGGIVLHNTQLEHQIGGAVVGDGDADGIALLRLQIQKLLQK